MENRKGATARALLEALKGLSDDQLLIFTKEIGKVRKYLGELVVEERRRIFVNPISDDCLRGNFPQFAGHLSSWRGLAIRLDYRGPVVWSVRKGFTLKINAPLAGPCHYNLDYLQDWPFVDTPTEDALVFWVPRLAPNSTNMMLEEMKIYCKALQVSLKMPANHCDRFGSIGLLFGLILAHQRRTGEWALSTSTSASDTMRSDGFRLTAGKGWNDLGGTCCDTGLCCDTWCDSVRKKEVGFFLLGIERLEEENGK